jgi:hypothetical protein
MQQVKRFIKYTIIFYVFIALIYWFFIHPKYINWGATSTEINMKFPIDEFVSPKRIVSTRPIIINATKEKIWPWIAQTGQNRGGFNSYYWLENLFGAKMVNANSIHPESEWQNPQPGDTFTMEKMKAMQLFLW